MSLDAATVTLLRETLRDALTGDSGRDGTAVLRALDGLGWDEVLAADEATAVGLFFAEQGAALTTSPALDAVALRAAGVPVPAARVAFATTADGWVPRTAPDRLHGALVLGPPLPDEPLLVAVRDAGGCALVVVEVPAGSWTPLTGLDPDAGWSVVDGPVREVAAPARDAVAEGAQRRAVAAARRALAAEIAAVSRAALDVAVAHVGAREQFGRPVGTFQTVRHRLAEAHAAVCGTEALLAAAWDVAADLDADHPDHDPDHAPERAAAEAAAIAKASAGATHTVVLGHALQVCGAMGLTWEHPLHRHARRGFLLDALLGGTDDLVAATGHALAAGRTPALAPLPRPDEERT